MRLLNTKSLSLEEFDGENAPPYAILSHRWEEEEVTYEELRSGRAPKRRGFRKLVECCRLARSRGYKYAWIDTCCIDKSSSAELTESINSMFRWYQRAKECYAYLTDVRSTQLDTPRERKEFSSSVWFTRGWTLQELIAPTNVLFFNRYWDYLGQKAELYRILSKITAIDPDILMNKMPLSECPIAQRMAWAANRTTTRLEDRAYSLLGIFDVYMPMLYGEGERAFQRLQEEIIKHSDDHTLFAWKDEQFAKSALAPSPSCFTGLDNLARIFPTNDTSQGFTLVNAGLSIQLQLVPWSMNTYLAPLRCGYASSTASESTQASYRGYDRACIFLQQTDHENQFIRVSVDGNDFVVLSGDTVAEMRDHFGLVDSQILIRQLSPVSYVRPAAASFYGFVFSFGHSSMFATRRWPRGTDVVCAHKWDPAQPVFEIANGQHHSAGMFRLSGLSTGHYIYFGFDRDFGPLCLITTRSPRSRRFTVLESDFRTLSDTDALRLLDLNWLREQIAEGTASGHAILAFKGDRRTRTEVECSSLLLRLVFEWRYSEITKMQSWHVSFNRLERAKSRDVSASISQDFDSSSAGFTDPREVSRLARSFSQNNHVQRPRNFSMPQTALGAPPRINVVDVDNDDAFLANDMSNLNFASRRNTLLPSRSDDGISVRTPRHRSGTTRTNTVQYGFDDGNVRVSKLDRGSFFTREQANSDDGNRVVEDYVTSYAVNPPPPRVSQYRRNRLSVDYDNLDNWQRPRSR